MALVATAAGVELATTDPPVGGSGDTATTVSSTGSDAAPIAPFDALERIGPWISEGMRKGRVPVDGASSAIDSLRSVLSEPPAPKAGSAELQAYSERAQRAAASVKTSLARIDSLEAQLAKLTVAMNDVHARLPQIAASASRWADHALADFGADQTYKARAAKQKESVLQLHVEALVAMQLARNEIGGWRVRIAELRTTSQTLLAQVSGPLPTVPVEEAVLVQRFPPVSGPPPEPPQPNPTTAMLVTTDPNGTELQEDSPVLYVLAAGLTTGALVASMYTIDRFAAFNDCANMPDGYGCTNKSEIESQAAAGRIATVTLSAAALGALIWALAD